MKLARVTEAPYCTITLTREEADALYTVLGALPASHAEEMALDLDPDEYRRLDDIIVDSLYAALHSAGLSDDE